MFCNRPVIEGPSRRPSAQADPPVPHATLQNVSCKMFFFSCNVKLVLHGVVFYPISSRYITLDCITFRRCSKSRSMEKE